MSELSRRQSSWLMQLARTMPFYRYLGITLNKVRQGGAEIQLILTRELTQDWGVAHGGAVTSLVDSAVGLALYSMLTPRDRIATVELKVNFIAPARLGLLRAVGKIIHKGKHLAVGEAEVKDARQRLIAKGIVTYMIISRKRKAST